MELTGRVRAIVAGLAIALAIGLASPASAQSYTFTKLADSAEDNFDPFSFGCATINAGETSPSRRVGSLRMASTRSRGSTAPTRTGV